jgi:predicted metalloprotease with PDZ domain
MPTEVYTDHQTANGGDTQAVSTCPNCSQLMPREMRFCRACGCRLGEGVEEYTETVRFQNAPQTARPRQSQTASTAPPQTSPAGVKDWGATLAREIREHTLRSANIAATAGLNHWKVARSCRRRVPKWMIWVFLPIIVFSIIGGPASFRHRGGNPAAAQTSYVGIESKSANGGAFIQDVTPPGSPADQAGLVGGDLIISLDGKPVTKESDVTNLLAQTPTGKTVNVIYVRDGETRTTKLTTVSKEEMDRLRETYGDSAKGFLGVEDDFKRVQVPNTNLYGVQLNKVLKNRPAYMVGLRDGDIVVAFDGIPIRTAEEFNMRIRRAHPESIVKITVMRGSDRLEIPVKMGEE